MGFFEVAFQGMNFIEIGVVLLFFLVVVIFIVAFCYTKFSKDGKESTKEEKDRVDSMIKNYGLIPENMKSWICFNFQSGVLFFTNDNKLLLVKMEDMKFLRTKEINLENILEIQADIKIKERNVLKIISIMPTFSNYKIVNGVTMRITTCDEVINLSLDTDIHGEYTLQRMNFKNTHRGWNWEQTIGELNRLKLLIEREMNKSNIN